jgi:hypothetical protein
VVLTTRGGVVVLIRRSCGEGCSFVLVAHVCCVLYEVFVLRNKMSNKLLVRERVIDMERKNVVR